MIYVIQVALQFKMQYSQWWNVHSLKYFNQAQFHRYSTKIAWWYVIREIINILTYFLYDILTYIYFKEIVTVFFLRYIYMWDCGVFITQAVKISSTFTNDNIRPCCTSNNDTRCENLRSRFARILSLSWQHFYFETVTFAQANDLNTIHPLLFIFWITSYSILSLSILYYVSSFVQKKPPTHKPGNAISCTYKTNKEKEILPK